MLNQNLEKTNPKKYLELTNVLYANFVISNKDLQKTLKLLNWKCTDEGNKYKIMTQEGYFYMD